MPTKRKSKAKQHKLIPSERAQLTLAFDAAGSAGVAVFYEGRLVGHAPADGTSWRTLLQATRPLLEAYQSVPSINRIMVIEQHWLNRMSSKGSMTLGQRRGIAQSVGEALGFERWEYIPSSTWQAKLFDGRVDDTKAASIAYTKQVYGVDPITDDVADSICLGDYFLRYRLTTPLAK